MMNIGQDGGNNMESVSLFIDESGNFGTDGRFFTIASVRCDVNDRFRYSRAVKKASLKIKKNFPTSCNDNGEVKASLSNCIAKDYMLRKIEHSCFRIDYITADLNYVEERLLNNQNILYNYLLTFLVKPVVINNSDLKRLNITIDNRTIKVGTERAFDEYIKGKIWVDYCRSDVDVNVEYVSSDKNYYIQGADFVANAINARFEKENQYFTNLIANKFEVRVKFPYRNFGN